MRDQDSKVAKVVSGWAGDDRVAEPREEGEGIAAPLKISRVQSSGMRAGERLTVCYRSCGRAIAVDPIRTGAENGNISSRNFRDARQHKS